MSRWNMFSVFQWIYTTKYPQRGVSIRDIHEGRIFIIISLAINSYDWEAIDLWKFLLRVHRTCFQYWKFRGSKITPTSLYTYKKRTCWILSRVTMNHLKSYNARPVAIGWLGVEIFKIWKSTIRWHLPSLRKCSGWRIWQM